MFVSLFGLKVNEVSVNDLAVTLRLTDKDGNCISVFFDDLTQVREFSRDIRRTVLDESDRNWQEFERPTLITD